MSISSLRIPFLILLLWLAGLGAAAQFAKIAVPFSFIRATYPDAGAYFGWLLTMISALGAIFGMTAGVMIARFGCKRVLVLSLLLGGAVSLWQSTMPTFPIMLSSRLIEGMSHLAIVVAAPTLIAEICPDRFRNMAMTLWSTFFGVAFGLMAWLGGPFVLAHGLGALFSAHGLFMLMLAMMLMIALPRPKDITQKIAPKITLSVKTVLRLHVQAYRSPNISAPAFGWLFYTLPFVSLLAILPDILPEDNRTVIASLMPLAGIAVSLVIATALLTRFSAVTVIILGFALAVLVIWTFTLGLPVAYVCITLFAVLGLVQGASFAAVPQLNTSPETRALANGTMAQMGNLGNLLGTPVLLVVLSYAGLPGMLIVVASLYLMGILAHMILARQRKIARPGSE